MADASYRFRIYTSGSSAVEVTFGSSQVQGFEEIGGQDVRPLEGRAESRPWSVHVADISTAVTSILADSSGRAVLLGRLADFQRNLDSSGWNTLGTGRLADILLNPDVASYEFLLENELALTLRQRIFTAPASPTVYAFPPGLMSTWAYEFGPRQIGNALLQRRSGNLSFVVLDRTSPASVDVMNTIRGDILSNGLGYSNASTAGNFNTLRFHCSTAAQDFEVWSIGDVLESQVDQDAAIQDQMDRPDQGISLWVVDPNAVMGSSSQISDVGIPLTGVYLYLPNHDPTPSLPYHVGGALGVPPFQLVQDIYEGTYGGAAVRYDSTALSNLINNRLYPHVLFRIEEPQNMGEWLETHIYAPFGVVPFVNSDGRIEPRSVLLPSSDIADIDALTEVTSTMLVAPHPTWQHLGRELVTVARVHSQRYSKLTDGQVAREGYRVPADYLIPTPIVDEFRHDRVTQLGERVHDLHYDGVGRPFPIGSGLWANAVIQETFDRYGDGPIMGRFGTLSSGTSGIRAGDYVKVTLATYPNIGTLGRGGTRIVQVLSRAETPSVPVFDYLDVGPDGTVLSAPTITASSSTGAANSPEAYHQLKVALSNITTDGGWQLQAGQSASTLARDSTAWYHVGSSDSSATVVLDRLKSGSTYFFRARNTKPQRWRSPWAYTTSGIATPELTGPSGLASTGHTASLINYSWNNSTASTGYLIEFQASTFGGTLATTQTLLSGTNRYTLSGLSAATTYTASIRYLDPYGGVSPSTSLSTETTSAAGAAATVGNIYLLIGDESTGNTYAGGGGDSRELLY